MARSFQLYDVVDLERSVQANAQGVATYSFDPVLPQHLWHLVFIAVFSTSAQNGPCRIFLDDPTQVANFRGGTASGIGDVDTQADLYVPASRVLIFQWTGLSAGASCSLAVQYEDLVGVGQPSPNVLTQS